MSGPGVRLSASAASMKAANNVGSGKVMAAGYRADPGQAIALPGIGTTAIPIKRRAARSAKLCRMNPVEKAVWFIEAQGARELTLDDVARVAGVSRFHMARSFGDATGWSVMRYARGRRLTQAAQALAAGAPDILG